ncbi:small nuclear ribonucleoprotein D2 [Encephalitozoon intestinalis ATCC 50506]|uniref:Small nuclear ribonucleoprotein Sm D2 n=1 Tax=Encephalitozoon intestinalis (strain ATCC 50506) TaxID=876142 RepID=E0S9U5_ENCIT|nr:small nuclear ribonucleoprotein D2 [Encephalitozoon intestinalis ATCC 50506]ADM12480.1 small nuclear ribonucleoprotein D2 [Encephalitozoon intestinalis ATCC 50506]UTX46317.1 small nuclear ribonucleoprotein D2 [Encephalitozoon intestinalis]
MFLPNNPDNPGEKESMEMKGPLSLVRRAMVKMIPVLISLRNNRKVTGKVVAYDRHYNLLVREAREFGTARGRNKGRKKRQGSEFSRKLGNVFIRGDTVILVAVGAEAEEPEKNSMENDEKKNTDLTQEECQTNSKV